MKSRKLSNFPAKKRTFVFENSVKSKLYSAFEQDIW